MNLKPHPKKLILWTLLGALALTARPGFAQSTDNSTTTDYSVFQVIPQRNIFNPNRYPNEPMNTQVRNTQVVPEFTLVGTMSYRKGMFAFFNGTDPGYQKSIPEGGTIAGFTVKNINMNGVALLSTNLSTNMMVGQAMQQEDDGWVLNDNGMSYSGMSGGSSFHEGRGGGGGRGEFRRRRGNYEGSSSTEQAAPASEAAPTPSSDLNNNDVLKRLMQQRQQQEK